MGGFCVDSSDCNVFAAANAVTAINNFMLNERLGNSAKMCVGVKWSGWIHKESPC